MVVCSNEWCDKYQQIHLSQEEYLKIVNHKWNLRNDRSHGIRRESAVPAEEITCDNCNKLCEETYCANPRVEGRSLCVECEERWTIILEYERKQLELTSKRDAMIKSRGRVPPFCPKCGTLAFPDPEFQINCTNFRCGYDGPLHHDLDQKIKKITSEINSHGLGSTTIEPSSTMSESGHSPSFLTLMKKSKSFSGYFEWPTTEIYPTFYGSQVDASEWPNQSPLNLMGYNVNSKENLSHHRRKEILSFVYASSTLPFVKSESYMLDWGPASSPRRLKKIADNLATNGRNMRKLVYSEPLAKYDADLDFLKEDYYDDMFGGNWPSTQPYN